MDDKVGRDYFIVNHQSYIRKYSKVTTVIHVGHRKLCFDNPGSGSFIAGEVEVISGTEIDVEKHA